MSCWVCVCVSTYARTHRAIHTICNMPAWTRHFGAPKKMFWFKPRRQLVQSTGIRLKLSLGRAIRARERENYSKADYRFHFKYTKKIDSFLVDTSNSLLSMIIIIIIITYICLFEVRTVAECVPERKEIYRFKYIYCLFSPSLPLFPLHFNDDWSPIHST